MNGGAEIGKIKRRVYCRLRLEGVSSVLSFIVLEASGQDNRG